MHELEALALGADVIDGEAAATEPGAMIAAGEAAQLEDQGAQNVQQIALMLALAVPLLGKLYPSIETIYTETAQGQVAQSLGPVLSKYGISLSEVAGSYGPEIAAAVVCIPLALATVAGVKSDIAAHIKQDPKGATLKAVQVVESEIVAVLG